MANKGRGLASASKATRIRVAREGGKASHGGGRKRNSSNQAYFSEVRPSVNNDLSSDTMED